VVMCNECAFEEAFSTNLSTNEEARFLCTVFCTPDKLVCGNYVETQ
jgi:hypothetical protein